jgi:hypothetical protein
MVSRGTDPATVTFFGGPWHRHTREYQPNQQIAPWALLGPLEVDGADTGLHGIYQLALTVTELGRLVIAYQFVRLITERKLRSGKWAIRVRPDRVMNAEAPD